MAAPALNASELRFLRTLLRRKVRLMAVGLSAAALRGSPVVTQDVELWFGDLNDPHIREALHEVGATYVAPSILNPPLFAGGGVELFDIVLTMHGLGTFCEERRNCVEVSLGRYRLKGLRLDRILAGKRAANRAKDRLVIPVLEDTVAARQFTIKPATKKASAQRKHTR